MIPTSGHVFYDGVNTSKLNLDAVRGNITIIPQQPELLVRRIASIPFERATDSLLSSLVLFAKT